MLAILLLIALLVIRTAPDSLLGRALRRPLVDWPAKRLSRLTRGQVICLAGFGLLLWAAIALLGHETAQIMSMAMPDTLAWFAAFDISAVADALVAAALLATSVRFKSAAQLMRRLRGVPRRPAGRARAPRRHRRPAAKPDNDGEPGPVLAFAA